MSRKEQVTRSPDAMTLSQSIKTLWPYLMTFKGRVILAVLALIAAKGATLLMPWALKEIIDAVDASINPLLSVPIALLIAYGLLRFASVFFGEVRDALFGRVTEHAMRHIGLKVFKHLHSLELAFHLDRQTGGISRDIERGTSGLSFLMRFLMFNIVPTLFEIITVAIIFATLFSPWFALVTLIAVASYIAFTVIVTQWRNRFIREANAADNNSNTRAIDSLLNYETVKYFNNEHYEARTYDGFLAKWEQARLKNRLSLLALNSGQALIIATAITALMWLGASSVVNKELTIGELVMINAYMIQLFLPLNFLGFVYREIRRALTDLENMLGLLNRKAAISNDKDAKPLNATKAAIRFENVSFSYDKQRPILNNLSFEVTSGSKVAIVGASGAGKSTLSRLLYRFYDVDAGKIYIDEQAINTVTLESLRQAIAIVPQDTVLFNTSIRENIAYGNPAASEDEIDQAISLAHLDGFIASLDKGDKTLVGERGLKVSGGEKQRIAIARAILKGSPILLFDEATSALDSHSEQAILSAMREVAQRHTSLVIAHRLSTITDADKIIVMKQGQVVEQGQHHQLLAANSEYARMWQLQQSEE
ncbi:ABC transporter ATP-binding protein/permease [Pseudoalteromonas shioyasakiensis]|uniref:ABC transporter ATP-binding protein/permease n=2 Tax=Pseudoalteromonas TaxID=53246 RepID=A0ABT6TVS8_9GAMM|nr:MULTISPECIES: ABC transporter ATP-binding protein/permease [Pseudoalteromonas]MDI4667900.1 ABC transporter ATP-binding protein/permease [Pseudoalteromonas shioyasakiensis]MDI4672870.1 ABC transporter ATP-binding protein/permease [Pseudoalteromonas shioyasakiensis]MDI4684934.1 ABC transporter ATP-binding protein/permease [Pseudoalteromonas shioyasakiensis]MDI4703102.1 ABC transporter ATP-binding protein/permease [Pseudoalteromonas shioyasakiensis]